MFRFNKICFKSVCTKLHKNVHKYILKNIPKKCLKIFLKKCFKICVQTLFSSIKATTIAFVFFVHGVVVIGMTRTYKFAACTVIVHRIECQRRWSYFGINIFVETSSLFSISISTNVKMAGGSKIDRNSRKKVKGKSVSICILKKKV